MGLYIYSQVILQMCTLYQFYNHTIFTISYSVDIIHYSSVYPHVCVVFMHACAHIPACLYV